MRRLLETDVEALELDVRLAADGVPVVLHDDRLDGLTTGTGRASEKTSTQLSELWLRVDGVTSPHAIPRLEEVLDLVGNARVLFLDAKDSGVRDTGLAAALADLVRRRGLYHTVIVESFNPVFLWRLRRIDPRVRIMFDFADDTTPTAAESPAQLAQIPWLLKQEPFRRVVRRFVRPDLLGPRFSVAPERLRVLADHGYPLVAWTVDDPEVALTVLRAGASAVMTNRPLVLQEALRGRLSRWADDASRLERTPVAGVVEVRSEDDVRRGLAMARAAGRRVSIAGRRHSMGGQTLGRDHVILDMTRYGTMSLDAKSHVLTVGSGAAWADVQRLLDGNGRSVLVMQSDNVFTVGGTLSVNAHGWQPRSPPIASTVVSFRLMLASGDVVTCSREDHPDLFRAALGGYGLLGVILDARLRTTENVLYRKRSYFVPAARYPETFRARVVDDPSAGLAYGRLSVDDAHFLEEAALYVYEWVPARTERLPPMSDEAFVALKRDVFRASERSEAGKRRRWLMEREVGPLLESSSTRNTVMNPDIHSIWPMDRGRRDILQEYFVPRDRFLDFLSGLGRLVRRHEGNLLNVTIRDVRRDDDTLLAYAAGDAFAFVLLFSQAATTEGEEGMRALTRDLVAHTLALGGSFYLPYRLHYTRAQFLRAYPRAEEFFDVKRRYDPDTLFSSRFFEHVSAGPP